MARSKTRVYRPGQKVSTADGPGRVLGTDWTTGQVQITLDHGGRGWYTKDQLGPYVRKSETPTPAPTQVETPSESAAIVDANLAAMGSVGLTDDSGADAD
ncbi:hypothetical protein [Nocardioides sp.]|uniref:hypothetical protein n=1 Tax=Nocardioides sp. TaxID=35761 RepID=UPI0039E68220